MCGCLPVSVCVCTYVLMYICTHVWDKSHVWECDVYGVPYTQAWLVCTYIAGCLMTGLIRVALANMALWLMPGLPPCQYILSCSLSLCHCSHFPACWGWLGCHLAHTLLLDDGSTSCIAFIHTAIAHSHCHMHWPGMSGVVGVLQLCMCACLSVCLSSCLCLSVRVWECGSVWMHICLLAMYLC